jgi:SurA N-terminal domain
LSTIRQLLLFGVLALGLTACGSSNQSDSLAARVNGQPISVADYNKQVVYRRIIDSQSLGVDVCQPKVYAAMCHQLKQTVLDTLIDDAVVHQYASRHGITVSSADFNRQWTNVFNTKFHGDAAVLRDYAKGLGFSTNDVKNTVRDGLLQQAVMYQITKTMAQSGPATLLARLAVGSESQLRSVQKFLKSGGKFLTVATVLSRQKNGPCSAAASRTGCGELGWYPDALLSGSQAGLPVAQPGSVVGPFSTQQALSLFLVQAHTKNYSYTTTQLASIRQVLFDAWVIQQVRRASVKRYAT